jgi:hypothetical protein
MRKTCLMLALLLVPGIGSARQEHPEHPERPTAPKAPLTIETVAKFLEGYVAKAAAEHDGWMMVHDDVANTDLKLKLDKIHRDRLAKIAEGKYFVCADFSTPEKKSYDLDFWVKETDRGLEVTETTIHKEDGKPRYNWVEKDGIWTRQPLAQPSGNQ